MKGTETYLEITAWNGCSISLDQKLSSNMIRVCISDETDHARIYINSDEAVQIINHLKEQFNL